MPLKAAYAQSAATAYSRLGLSKESSMAKTKKGGQHKTTEQQLAEAEQRLNRLREKARQEDTRRKILVGAMILSEAQQDTTLHGNLMSHLDSWLSAGHRDRRLFVDYGLGPIAGLYGKTLHPLEHLPGWAFSRTLSPAKPSLDRYGNPISA